MKKIIIICCLMTFCWGIQSYGQTISAITNSSWSSFTPWYPGGGGTSLGVPPIDTLNWTTDTTSTYGAGIWNTTSYLGVGVNTCVPGANGCALPGDSELNQNPTDPLPHYLDTLPAGKLIWTSKCDTVGQVSYFRTLLYLPPCFLDTSNTIVDLIANADDEGWIYINGTLIANVLNNHQPYAQFIPNTGNIIRRSLQQGWNVIAFACLNTQNYCAGLSLTINLIDTGVSNACSCQSVRGTNFISSYSNNLSYTYYDSFTAIQPNFINWIVDDSVWGQTGGADTFYHTFSPGFHTVCMQTATILTNADGSNICCYNTICDTVNIDACEYWKSTDTITYQLNTTNIDSVTFTFHGSTSPISPTIVWNFGDGTTLVSTDLTVTHVFSPIWVEKHRNKLEVCADIIWSKGDSINYDSLSVCCCLDHRCFPVVVSVCNIASFNVELLSDNIYTGAYVFDVVSAPAGVVSIDMPSWISSDGSSTTDWTFEDDITYDTEYDICATFDYYVTYQGKPYECPTTTVCLDTFLSNPNPKDRFRAYPNPTTGQMVVEITNNTNAKSAKIEVSDVTGQVLLSTVNSLTTGINQKFMNLSNLSQGVYTIKMTIGNEQQMIKLVKE